MTEPGLVNEEGDPDVLMSPWSGPITTFKVCCQCLNCREAD